MAASFTVYIDESGDEGFVFQPGEQGSSRWLVLSAVVFRKRNDLQAVRLMADLRTRLGKLPKQALHFRHLRHEQRVPVARAIGEAPFIRTVSVLIHKPSIREPERFQSEPFRLYRYACRLLLERVSWLCRDKRVPDQGDGTAEITFSNRSAMSYDDLRGYLNLLHDAAEVKDVRVDWAVIRPTQVRAVNHDQLAGLQLADAVASGLFYALNLNPYGEAESRYLDLLAPTTYRHKGSALGYGLKFWPHDLAMLAELLPHARAFERHK